MDPVDVPPYGGGVFDSEGECTTTVAHALEDMMTASVLDPTAHRLRLALCGEIDIATVPGAVAGVIDARPSPGDVVTLDMSEVSFIDSTGISMLISVHEYLHGIGCQLALAHPSAPLVRVLAMVGLSEHFPIEID